MNQGQNQNDMEVTKLITLTAFLIGYALVETLDSNEQNSVGNFFMLVGQTLCTAGAENFRKDWKKVPGLGPLASVPNGRNHNGPNGNSQGMTREQAIEMLHKARDTLSQEIDKLQ